ncbi:MAG: hypothetical protein WBB23_06495 [Desulforhopalus sp.]
MSFDNRKSNLLFLCLSIFVIIGVWGRFNALGRWPLAEDEYYFMQSVMNILNTGIPEYPSGGYYIRGILQQYITAGIELFLKNPELSGRIVTVIANICAIPAVYIIGNFIGGRNIAISACCLFLISSLEIEFSRFARMYAPFQAVFLWFLAFIISSFNTRENKYRFFLHITIILGLLLHKGAIFMLSTIAAVYILQLVKSKRWEWVALFIYAAIAFQLTRINFRRLGAPDPWPKELLPTFANGPNLPIDIPYFLFHRITDEPWLFALFFCIVVISTFMMITGVKKWSLSPSFTFGWILAWTAAFFNQLLFSVLIIFSLLSLSPFKYGIFAKDRESNAVRWLIAGILFVASFWLFFITKLILSDTVHISVQSAIKYLVNYPRIFARFVEPWFAVMPFFTIIIGVTLVVGSLLLIFKPSLKWNTFRQSIGVLIIIVLPFSMIDTAQVSTRYSFFIYPFILILLLSSVAVINNYIFPENFRGKIFWVVFCLIILLGSDFKLSYPFNIGSKEANFRLGVDQVTRNHYYDRLSYREAADYVNDRVRGDDIVISGAPVVDFYLKKTDFVYFDYRGFRFQDITAVGGSREIWSNLPLIHNPEDLKAIIQKNKARTWLVLQNDLFNQRGPIHKMLIDELKSYRSYRTFDKRIDVYLVTSDH